jgi:AcrR family transcriptional regulator
LKFPSPVPAVPRLLPTPAPAIPASADPRERILAAAGREFADHGYESATVRDICLAAGVNVAAVNYYFGDKRSLYLQSVRHAHEHRVRQKPLPVWSASTPPGRRLHDFVANMLERMLGFGPTDWQARLMLREVLQPTEACREMVEDYIRPQFELLVAILDSLTDHQLPPARLRQEALGVVGQCFLYRAAGDVVRMLVPADEQATHHTLRSVAEHVTRHTLAALGVGAPAAGRGRRDPAGMVPQTRRPPAKARRPRATDGRIIPPARPQTPKEEDIS